MSKTFFEKNLSEKKEMSFFSLLDLINNGIHIGHNSKKRHPKIAKYLLGSRNNVDIFDLNKTTLYLKHALNFIFQLVLLDRKILIVNENNDFKKLIQYLGQKTQNPYVSKKWVGGYLTNFNKQYFKVKEPTINDSFFPSAIFILSVKRSPIAIKEAIKLQIPIIGIVDSDANPEGITYPIFGNDDSIESTFFYISLFKAACYKAYLKKQTLVE